MVMIAAMRLDYRKLRQPAVVYAAVIATTLLLIAVLFLRPVNDTHRWIRLGELSFQPAELAKLSAILFLAYHLERKQDRIDEFLPSLFPVLLLLGWFAFLIFIQPDLGTAATIVLIGGVMLYLAGVRLRYFAALAALAALRALPGGDGGGLPARPHRGLPEPVVRRPRLRLPGHPEPDRGGHRRPRRRRPDGGAAEALLPALSVQRLHLRRDRRGAGPAGRGARCCWPSCSCSGAGCARPGGRPTPSAPTSPPASPWPSCCRPSST